MSLNRKGLSAAELLCKGSVVYLGDKKNMMLLKKVFKVTVHADREKTVKTQTKENLTI